MKQSVISGIRLASMCEGGAPYGLVEDAGIAIEGDMIVWAGAMSNLPERFSGWERTDFGGRLATPALVDCHTHLVFGGNRAREFEMRLEGASYEEVARAGGGIVSTVSATRGQDEDALVEDRTPQNIARAEACEAEISTRANLSLSFADEEVTLYILREPR